MARAAQYQAGNYQAAIQSLQGLNDEDSRYNLANAQAQAGQLEQAKQGYENILKPTQIMLMRKESRHSEQSFAAEKQQQNQDEKNKQQKDQDKNKHNQKNDKDSQNSSLKINNHKTSNRKINKTSNRRAITLKISRRKTISQKWSVARLTITKQPEPIRSKPE